MNVCVKEPCWGRGPAAGAENLRHHPVFSKFQEAAGGAVITLWLTD